jgi:spore maturation protein CgeB
VVVYQAETEDGVRRCLDEARSADLIVKASGVGVFDELLAGAVLDTRRPGALAAFWDVDAPATLDRVQSNPEDPFAPLIARYDLILTYGGGDPVVGAYKRLGAHECVPVYNALDPETHHPVPPEPRFESDLAFIGNRLPDREARVEEFFMGAAARLPARRFLIGGNGWQERPMPSNVVYTGHVYTADHNAFNCTPLAVLNISRESMARYGFSPATRVFEAAGARACLITDEWEGIELFLEPGREVLVARDGAEVASMLHALTPKEASKIGKAALRRILAHHTYAHRAKQFDLLLAGADHALEAVPCGRLACASSSSACRSRRRGATAMRPRLGRSFASWPRAATTCFSLSATCPGTRITATCRSPHSGPRAFTDPSTRLAVVSPAMFATPTLSLSGRTCRTA